MQNLSPRDRVQILSHSGGLLEGLRGARIFITGGTGFFGCMMLEVLLAASTDFGLDLKIVLLTRSAERFRLKARHLASEPSIILLEGDVRTFDFPTGLFTHVIHAATEASVKLAANDPLEMFSTILDGTKRVLEFTRNSGARSLLFTSSGAVYGRQPSELSHVSEEYCGAPDPMDPRSVYGVGKRAAEQLCALYAKQYGIESKIARCFAFVGPYLPLDIHFAIGNFIRDAMAGSAIRIHGDGTPVRSYLYATDLVIWLMTILLRGESGRAYNVGSEREVSIQQLARMVLEVTNSKMGIEILKQPVPGQAPERYIPSTARARLELGLQEHVGLEEAISRTIAWHAGRSH